MSEHSFEVFAPAGIGEVAPGADVAALVIQAVAADPRGPVREGDVLVVTSKILSKAEGRFIDTADKDRALHEESRRVLARRGPTMIVEHRLGLVHAAAGIDSSNVETGRSLLLPRDPDASARSIRERIAADCGVGVGVLISDTAGRAWRVGQTDQAIGSAGVLTVDSHIGRHDSHGNELHVTEIAVADELCAAADLARTKLGGRPVAVIRGLGHLVTDTDGSARELQRAEAQDFFRLGRREAVLAAVLAATGQSGRYDEVVLLDGDELVEAVVSGAPADRGWITRLLRA